MGDRSILIIKQGAWLLQAFTFNPEKIQESLIVQKEILSKKSNIQEGRHHQEITAISRSRDKTPSKVPLLCYSQ